MFPSGKKQWEIKQKALEKKKSFHFFSGLNAVFNQGLHFYDSKRVPSYVKFFSASSVI